MSVNRNFVCFLLVVITVSGFGCQNNKLAENQLKAYRSHTKSFISSFFDKSIRKGYLVVAEARIIQYDDCVEEFLKHSIMFTKEEKETIIAQIKSPILTEWKAEIFGSVKFIRRDTLHEFFENKWWLDFYEEVGPGFSSFSSPIFLRDYTMCVFYFDYTCGGKCGKGQVAIFKKENGSWKPVKRFCYWVS